MLNRLNQRIDQIDQIIIIEILIGHMRRGLRDYAYEKYFTLKTDNCM